MRPTKEFRAAREHFDETSTLELFFPCLIFEMRYQKLSPWMNHARITQELCKRTVQAFYLFQDSAVHPLLCNNNNTTRGPLQLQYSVISEWLFEWELSLRYSSRDYANLQKWFGELLVPYLCKFCNFFNIFVVLYFNQYLISRLFWNLQQINERLWMKKGTVFQKD